MKRRWRKLGRVTTRSVVCTLLLLWIFNSIFVKEGKQYVAERQGDWEALSSWEQWRIAWQHGPTALWGTVHQVNPGAFLLSLVFMGTSLFLGLCRWRLMLHVQRLYLPLGRAVEISLVAHFFNSFLLGSTGGDLLKAYYTAREAHTKKTEAVMTVFIDRLIGLFSMLLFASLMIAPNAGWMLEDRRMLTLTGLVLALMLGCGAVIVLAFWGGRFPFWPRLKRWLGRLPWGEFIERSLDALQRLGPAWKYLGKALNLSMVLNLVCVFQVLALAWGLNIDISLKPLLVVVPIVICLSAVPITPNGLGIRENLFVWMLTVPALQVDPTKALSLSLLAYAGSLFWSLVGGLVYVTLKESQHLTELSE